MAVIKCKMCGGTVELQNETEAVCEYCGTRYPVEKSRNDISQKNQRKKYVVSFEKPFLMKVLYVISLIITCFCGAYFCAIGYLNGDLISSSDIEFILNFLLLIIGFVSVAPILVFKKILRSRIVPILLQAITSCLSAMWFVAWLDELGQINFCIAVNLIIQIVWFIIICFTKKEEIKNGSF